MINLILTIRGFEILPNAFFGFDKLTELKIPSRIKKIGYQAFRECRSLQRIYLPESIDSIGWSAFDECVSLISITLPPSVEQIDSYTFHNCKSLETIILSDNVSVIGERAFENCASLKEVIISQRALSKDAGNKKPDSFIGDYAFCGCKNLIKVDHTAFINCPNLSEIWIPSTTMNRLNPIVKSHDDDRRQTISNQFSSLFPNLEKINAYEIIRSEEGILYNIVYSANMQ